MKINKNILITFELKLSNGKTVQWEGFNYKNAIDRFLSQHPEETITAWRFKRHDLKIGMINIIQ